MGLPIGNRFLPTTALSFLLSGCASKPPPETPTVGPDFVPYQPYQMSLKEPHLVALIGDPQFHVPPYFQSSIRSLLVESRFPGHRLPGSNLGISLGMETLLRESIPDSLRPHFQGVIMMGDVADVANTEELGLFAGTMGRLQRYDPRYQTLLFLIGNHDTLHAGNLETGSEFFGSLRGFFHVRGGSSYYQRDIASPEAGSEGNRLDKLRLIRWIASSLYRKESTVTGHVSREEDRYRLIPLLPPTEGRFGGVWSRESPESWRAALCRLEAQPTALQTCATPSARRLSNLKTKRGEIPLYFVGLDTMDYLIDSPDERGSLDGHVSAVQVQAVSSLIRETKAQEPDALFILGGHYPVTKMRHVVESGLGKLLSEPSVIAYVGAHTHWRGYVDLNHLSNAAAYGIRRRAPLPQVTVPSVIDFPNEMVLMLYGVEEQVPDTLTVEFQFTGFNRDEIPGTSPEVLQELAGLDLVTFDDAIAHIREPRLKRAVQPATPLREQIGFLLNNRDGLLSGQHGKLNELLIAEDVIPAMVQDVHLFSRIFISVGALDLKEAGFGPLADRFSGAGRRYLEALQAYYEQIWRHQWTGDDHPALARVEEAARALDLELPETETSSMMRELSLFLRDYQAWLNEYERKERAEIPYRDRLRDADLFGNPHFRNLFRLVRDVRYGTQSHAFLVHLFLRSAEGEYRFYPQRQETVRVPDRIRLRISTSSGEVVVSTPSLSSPMRYSTEIAERILVEIGK